VSRVNDLLVRIRGDGADLENELNRTARNLDAVGRRFERVGRDLTLKFTAPLVAAGAVATKLASDFDQEMTKIVTLVGVAEDQVNDWRRALLEMAPAVGRGPTELAQALFVVTSAGQRGASALQIVERAAKASAVGLGDTAEIARAVTAAMQAYGAENLSAERATDILMATVREGNLEASALAGSLGRVLGIASQVGVTFDQVGGFIATFTRLGVSAEEAVTSLTGVLSTLIRPTEGTRRALRDMGLSVEELRVSIVERGLSQTLVDLVQRSRDMGVEIADVIPNVRALAGVLGTAAAQGESFVDVSGNIARSSNILDDAFARVEQTTAFTFAQLRANLQALAIAMGDALAPTVNELVRSLIPLLRTMQGLDPEFVANTARVLAITAAIGPMVLAMGSAARTAATLANTLFLARTAGVALGTALLPAGAVIAGLALLSTWLIRTQANALQAGVALAELRAEAFALSEADLSLRITDRGTELAQVLAQLREARELFDQLRGETAARLGRGVSPGDSAQLRAASDSVQELEGRAGSLRQELGVLYEAQRRIADTAERMKREHEEAARQAKALMEELSGVGRSAEEAGKQLRTPAEVLEDLERRLEVARRVGELSDAFDAGQLAVSAYQAALQELAGLELADDDEQILEVARRFNELRDEIAGVEQVMATLEERLALAQRLGDLSDSFDAQALSVSAYEDALQALVGGRATFPQPLVRWRRPSPPSGGRWPTAPGRRRISRMR
jgi:TP901 family phage tail tape measure protein